LVFAVAIAAWQAERQFEDWREVRPMVIEPVGVRW
jgi:hypothetical protein